MTCNTRFCRKKFPTDRANWAHAERRKDRAIWRYEKINNCGNGLPITPPGVDLAVLSDNKIPTVELYRKIVLS